MFDFIGIDTRIDTLTKHMRKMVHILKRYTENNKTIGKRRFEKIKKVRWDIEEDCLGVECMRWVPPPDMWKKRISNEITSVCKFLGKLDYISEGDAEYLFIRFSSYYNFLLNPVTYFAELKRRKTMKIHVN